MENNLPKNSAPQKTFIEKLNLASFFVFGILGLGYIVLDIMRNNTARPEQIFMLEKSLDMPIVFSGLVYVLTLVRLRFKKVDSPYFDQILISVGVILLLVLGYISIFVEDLA